MKAMNWTGSKGNKIELRASCETKMETFENRLDGTLVGTTTKPHTTANLELWVDGKKIKSCWDTNFWSLIDVKEMPGFKKIWGLPIAMDEAQAEKVERLLKSVIEDGKTEEVKASEEAQKVAEQAAKIEEAKEIIAQAEKTIRNADGSLMTRKQAQVWKKHYNDVHNEGGEGYVPTIITAEDVEYAESIIAKGE